MPKDNGWDDKRQSNLLLALSAKHKASDYQQDAYCRGKINDKLYHGCYK